MRTVIVDLDRVRELIWNEFLGGEEPDETLWNYDTKKVTFKFYRGMEGDDEGES